MTSKTWTATDVKLGKLVLLPSVEGKGYICVVRRYRFVDVDGNVMEQIAGGQVRADVEFASLPQNVRDALLLMDSWTKNLALEQEDML